jgi:hypothetical protein
MNHTQVRRAAGILTLLLDYVPELLQQFLTIQKLFVQL